MKKKNFKKPLLVCLSVLTLFSASATSIASLAIDNKTAVVERGIPKRAIPKRANEVNDVDGIFNNLVDIEAYADNTLILELNTSMDYSLDGSSNFAIVVVPQTNDLLRIFESNLESTQGDGNLIEKYTLESTTSKAFVYILSNPGRFEFNFEDAIYEGGYSSSVIREGILASHIYAGYFGQSSSSRLTLKNIPGMEEEDISGPLISGSQKTYTTSVDNPISVETIKSALTAQDETDGDVTTSIIVKSDDYTNNCHTLGTYNIVFAAYDKAGNESILTVTVIVQDLVDPVITGPDTLTLSYSNPKTLEDIKSQYAVTDNYDTSISIEVDAQSPNYDGTKVGTYSITLKAKDSSNHIVRKTITVNVVDDVAPVFSGASSFVTNNSTSASLDDVMANCNIKATDEISGECEVRIKSETLTGNADKVGNYEVVYEATDAAGNISEFKVSVSITDGIPPVFYIDNTVIYAANDIMMTNVDLCNLMIATCEIDASKPYSLSITDTDGYLAACADGKEVALGNYEVTATVSYKDGNKDVYTKTISVYDAETSDIETKEVKLNFFEAIGQFFKNWKAAWDEGGFKLWWQKLFNGDLFTENMTKIVEVEKEVENKTSETSGK